MLYDILSETKFTFTFLYVFIHLYFQFFYNTYELIYNCIVFKISNDTPKKINFVNFLVPIISVFL